MGKKKKRCQGRRRQKKKNGRGRQKTKVLAHFIILLKGTVSVISSDLPHNNAKYSPNVFLQAATSYVFFPDSNISYMQFPKRQLPKSDLAAAFRPLCSLQRLRRPNQTLTVHLESCRLEDCTIGNLSLGKLPLGNLPLGKFPLGKLPLRKLALTIGLWEST